MIRLERNTLLKCEGQKYALCLNRSGTQHQRPSKWCINFLRMQKTYWKLETETSWSDRTLIWQWLWLDRFRSIFTRSPAFNFHSVEWKKRIEPKAAKLRPQLSTKEVAIYFQKIISMKENYFGTQKNEFVKPSGSYVSICLEWPSSSGLGAWRRERARRVRLARFPMRISSGPNGIKISIGISKENNTN